MKAIRSGDEPSPDLFEADFDHERAAVLGSAIDLAFQAAPVRSIDASVVDARIEDVCGYGESPAKAQKVAAAKTALKNAWVLGIQDVLINNEDDHELLTAADRLCVPASGTQPAISGIYPNLRTRLQQGINTAVEEGVNFIWTVPGVTGAVPAGSDKGIAVRKSLGTLRELAALDRNHLGPALVALKGSVFVGRLHAEQQARRGKNLGYRLDRLTLDEDGRAVFRQDPLDLEVDMAEGKTMQVAHVGPNRVFPLGCPALKIKAFTAAARCVIDVFDQHELWPVVQPG